MSRDMTLGEGVLVMSSEKHEQRLRALAPVSGAAHIMTGPSSLRPGVRVVVIVITDNAGNPIEPAMVDRLYNITGVKPDGLKLKGVKRA